MMQTALQPDRSSNVEQGLRQAEVESLKLAAKGRLVAIGVVSAYSTLSFSGGLLYNTLLYAAAFADIALTLLLVAGTRFDRVWVKYLLVMLEIALLADAVLTPNPFNPEPWPNPMVYRYENFYYFLIIIAIAVFSYSPALVMWTGCVTALAWGLGLWWISSMPGTITFADLPEGATSADTLAFYLDPQLVIFSSRIKEILTAVLVALILAVVVWRGRRTVSRLLSSDQDRRFLEDMFGRYVPSQVAQAIIDDRGVLTPEERTSTVLFADVAGFTTMVERMAPQAVLETLNDYFAAANEIVGRHGGVVTQFQGDGFLATFNVPIEDRNHARSAVDAARELLTRVRSDTFNGHSLRIRIGISTGTVIAGSVGGDKRMLYTVHGDAVNVAARLEELNKANGTELLVSETTVMLIAERSDWRRIGEVTLRGKAEPIVVYSHPPTGRGEALAV